MLVNNNHYCVEQNNGAWRIKKNGVFCSDKEVIESLNVSQMEFDRFMRIYGHGSASSPVCFADFSRAKLALICLCGYAQA